MPPSGSVSSADQEFLALLVHKGFLGKGDAMDVLKGVGEDGFDATLATFFALLRLEAFFADALVVFFAVDAFFAIRYSPAGGSMCCHVHHIGK